MVKRKNESSADTLACIKTEMNLPRIAKSARNEKPRMSVKREKALLEGHRLHLGLYRRVADRLGVDASYVSKVTRGTPRV